MLLFAQVPPLIYFFYLGNMYRYIIIIILLTTFSFLVISTQTMYVWPDILQGNEKTWVSSDIKISWANPNVKLAVGWGYGSDL